MDWRNFVMMVTDLAAIFSEATAPGDTFLGRIGQDRKQLNVVCVSVH